MHFNRIGLNLKPLKRHKMKQYLGTKMKMLTHLINKYGTDVLDGF